MAITNYQVAATVSTGAYASSGDNAITVIYITNKSATDGNVDVYLVPSANVSSFESSPSQNYKIYNNLLVKAQDTYIIDSEKLILSSGDKIYIAAPDSAAQFNATISTIGL
jgi:hypothetical protein